MTTISAPYSAHGGGVELGARNEVDVLQPVDLNLAVVDHPSPLTEAGQLRNPPHRPAELGGGVDEVHAAHSPLAQHDRALHPRGTGADDQHIVVGVGGTGELLRVPAAPVLLTGRRVLRAYEPPAADLEPRQADVAADALADLVEAARLDLLG